MSNYHTPSEIEFARTYTETLGTGFYRYGPKQTARALDRLADDIQAMPDDVPSPDVRRMDAEDLEPFDTDFAG